MKERLDILLLNKGLAPSREKAKAMIMAGQVFVDNQREDKAGSLFDQEKAHIEVRGSALKYVSRGGLKLEKAFSSFPLNLAGRVCMDIGASTGGFTDCMLQNGAAKVYAVDVGYGQLDWKLRSDERVVCMEKTNFRYLRPDDLPEQMDFASCDVSFISLTRILLPAFALLKKKGQMVCLIKPQFEAGRDKVGKKGVVRDRTVHREVIEHVVDFADMIGFAVRDLDYSPVRGPEGNIEYLLFLEKNTQESDRTSQIPGQEKTIEFPDTPEVSENAESLNISKETLIMPDDSEVLTERQALERVHDIWKEKTGLSNREDWMTKIMDTVAAAHEELDR